MNRKTGKGGKLSQLTEEALDFFAHAGSYDYDSLTSEEGLDDDLTAEITDIGDWITSLIAQQFGFRALTLEQWQNYFDKTLEIHGLTKDDIFPDAIRFDYGHQTLFYQIYQNKLSQYEEIVAQNKLHHSRRGIFFDEDQPQYLFSSVDEQLALIDEISWILDEYRIPTRATEETSSDETDDIETIIPASVESPVKHKYLFEVLENIIANGAKSPDFFYTLVSGERQPDNYSIRLLAKLLRSILLHYETYLDMRPMIDSLFNQYEPLLISARTKYLQAQFGHNIKMLITGLVFSQESTTLFQQYDEDIFARLLDQCITDKLASQSNTLSIIDWHDLLDLTEQCPEILGRHQVAIVKLIVSQLSDQDQEAFYQGCTIHEEAHEQAPYSVDDQPSEDNDLLESSDYFDSEEYSDDLKDGALQYMDTRDYFCEEVKCESLRPCSPSSYEEIYQLGAYIHQLSRDNAALESIVNRFIESYTQKHSQQREPDYGTFVDRSFFKDSRREREAKAHLKGTKREERQREKEAREAELTGRRLTP